jgi:uncharacterized protein (TIGR03435 family)
MSRTRIATAAALLASGLLIAGNSFEVASIKPTPPTENYVTMLTYPGGRLSIKNHTLSMLMEEAYLVESERIDGGPRWVYQDVYSIEAKAPANSAAAAFIPASATAAAVA